ncbi:MAG TPA: Gfo/Idh/MocA family oxidoreductase [Conexibacter sp.]|jgi:xylose dehydrogenase (NAD/NADP)|nr:Gfo/Idh/MocA family oxidoreductase [Conexibacter sp.]
MTNSVRWGLLSTASINDPVLEGCAGSGLVAFAAVASRSEQKARAWAAERGIPRAHGSYEALLADPEIDAIYLPLPNALHVEWTLRALEAGKHVLCEKPFSDDPAAVGAAFDVAEREGLVLAEAFMWRFHPQTARIRELLVGGAIGELRVVRAALSFPLEDVAHDVRTLAELDGGSLMDVGCYCVSGFRMYAGEPQQASGHATRASSGVDMRFAGTLFGADGVVGQFDCGMDLPRRDHLELVGSAGTIVVPDPWHCRGEPFELRVGERRETIAVDPIDAYRAELEAVSRAIRGGEPVAWGREDAVAQARSLEALRRSAEQDGALVPLG